MIHHTTSSNGQNAPPTDERTNPTNALEGCREYGLEGEGQWIYDVRAKYVQLEEVSPSRVIVVTETGSPLPIGTAVDLYDMCRSNHVHPIASTAIADAQHVVHTLASQQLDEIMRHRELSEPCSPTESVHTVADVVAAVHFFEKATERGCSPEAFLPEDCP